jgi:hypothetical protein
MVQARCGAEDNQRGAGAISGSTKVTRLLGKGEGRRRG